MFTLYILNQRQAWGLTRRVVQASVGTSLGGICHLAHEGFVVFTPAVCTPGHQAQYAKFPTPMTDHRLQLLIVRPAFSSHHLEYGFPSTHSTNSISIALFIYSYVHRLHFSDSSISSTSYCVYLIGIIVYAFSIVFGRIYAAMHSFTDCIFGIIVGAVIWAFQHFYLERIVEAITHGGLIGKS